MKLRTWVAHMEPPVLIQREHVTGFLYWHLLQLPNAEGSGPDRPFHGYRLAVSEHMLRYFPVFDRRTLTACLHRLDTENPAIGHEAVSIIRKMLMDLPPEGPTASS